jgi:hypothetical protein
MARVQLGFNQALRFTGYEAARETVTRQMLIGTNSGNPNGLLLGDLVASAVNQVTSTLSSGYTSSIIFVTTFSPKDAVSSLASNLAAATKAGYINGLEYAKSISPGEVIASQLNGVEEALHKLSESDILRPVATISGQISSLASQFLSGRAGDAPASPEYSVLDSVTTTLAESAVQLATSQVSNSQPDLLPQSVAANSDITHMQLRHMISSLVDGVLAHVDHSHLGSFSNIASKTTSLELHSSLDALQLDTLLSLVLHTLSQAST